jgi:hypothetical protein
VQAQWGGRGLLVRVWGEGERGAAARGRLVIYGEGGAADFMGWAKCGLLGGGEELMGHCAATGPAVEEQAVLCRPTSLGCGTASPGPLATRPGQNTGPRAGLTDPGWMPNYSLR